MTDKSGLMGSPKDNQDIIFKTKDGNISAGYFDKAQKAFLVGWTGAIGEPIEDVVEWYDLAFALECCRNSKLY